MPDQRWWPITLSVTICLALLWPIRQNWQEFPEDDFPLSYYPMFSHKRAPTYKAYYIVGFDAVGQRHLLSYKYAGTGGFNQVRRYINQMAREGKGDQLLERVADRWVRRRLPDPPTLSHLYLVKGEYHLEHFFGLHQRTPLREEVLATLDVLTHE